MAQVHIIAVKIDAHGGGTLICPICAYDSKEKAAYALEKIGPDMMKTITAAGGLLNLMGIRGAGLTLLHVEKESPIAIVGIDEMPAERPA
jgi:hypothetical protein